MMLRLPVVPLAMTLPGCPDAPTPAPSTTTCEACDGACVADDWEDLPGEHLDDDAEADYSDTPPAGGDHSGCWATWGVHGEADPVRDENWVHNLEHGGIVFLWKPGEAAALDVAALEEWVATISELALSTPYEDMEYPFAAVAWEHRMLLGCYDQDALQQFYQDHVDQAPESVTADPSSSCME